MRSWDYKSLQKVVFDSIPGHDFSRHADPVSSVHCKTDSDVGRKSPQDHRGVSFIPGPPSCSLASSSGPPFVPFSFGEGWDVKDAISRFASSPDRTFETGCFASLGIICVRRTFYGGLGRLNNEGRRSSLPVPDLSFYSDESDVGWGAIIGEQQVSGVWTPGQWELSINLREMRTMQKGLLEFSSLLRGNTIFSEATRSPSLATMSRQSLTSGDREAQGLRSCSSKRGRFSCS